jgi:hypothetical protein
MDPPRLERSPGLLDYLMVGQARLFSACSTVVTYTSNTAFGSLLSDVRQPSLLGLLRPERAFYCAVKRPPNCELSLYAAGPLLPCGNGIARSVAVAD